MPPRPRRTPSLARLAGAVALAGLAACRDPPADERGDLTNPDSDTASAVPGAPPPRRPAHKYVLRRTQDRCEIAVFSGDAESPPVAVICPPDLQVGERVRLAGKTCMRESPASPSREVPVICPEPLRAKEKADRDARDAGR